MIELSAFRAIGVLAPFVLALTACQRDGTPDNIGSAACEGPFVPISTIQGSTDRSPLIGQSAQVRGIVTATVDDGVYLESQDPDGDSATSEGLFLANAKMAGRRSPGDVVAVSGVVRERGTGPDTLTSLEQVAEAGVCAQGVRLPINGAELPLSTAERESLEGMRLSLSQLLVVTDVYRLRQNWATISLETILPAPTEVALPGDDARAQAQRNQRRSLPLLLTADVRQAFPVGTVALSPIGVFARADRSAHVLLEDSLSMSPPRLIPVPPPEPGHVRVVSLNLHNYFNGDGSGGGFPTPRGAATPAEFEDQRSRLKASLRVLDPHLVAVMELENDGFDAASAAADFIRDLSDAIPAPWQVVDPGIGPIGGDAITVGLFYRDDRLAPVGQSELLTTGTFLSRSRVPIAQAFAPSNGGASFLVAVNHFKSKGSCPDDGPDADQGDGQGCWNPTRLDSARALVPWVRRLADRQASGHTLILGDLNAYRMEEPIRHIVDAGFVDLTAYGGFEFDYSYVYAGRAGTLDYAFATPGLQALVWRAEIPHINAGYPPGMPLDRPWLRASDHDPVVVDLRLRHASTAP